MNEPDLFFNVSISNIVDNNNIIFTEKLEYDFYLLGCCHSRKAKTFD